MKIYLTMTFLIMMLIFFTLSNQELPKELEKINAETPIDFSDWNQQSTKGSLSDLKGLYREEGLPE